MLLTPAVVQAAKKTRGGAQTTTGRRKRLLMEELVYGEENVAVDCSAGTSRSLTFKAAVHVPTRKSRRTITKKVYGESDTDS